MSITHFNVNKHPLFWELDTSRMSQQNAEQAKRDAAAVVSVDPWNHTSLQIGSVSVTGRLGWGGYPPTWTNVVTYYNTKVKPLVALYDTIVIHHTNNW